MSFINSGVPMAQIFYGYLLLVGCCLFYLLWWGIAFKPHTHAPLKVTAPLIVIAGLLGIGGVVLTCYGMNQLSFSAVIIPGPYLWAGGIVVYIILLASTYLISHRQVTTELLLIVGWCALEISTINVFYGLSVLSYTMNILMMIGLVMISIINMIAYMRYYDLDEEMGYKDGMIPLILCGLTMIMFLVIMH